MATPERENPEVDLVFREPVNTNNEMVQDLSTDKIEEENNEIVNVELLFRLPNDIRFELIHTILGNFEDPLPDSIPISEEQHYDDSVISESIPLVEPSVPEVKDVIAPSEQSITNEVDDEPLSDGRNNDLPFGSEEIDEKNLENVSSEHSAENRVEEAEDSNDPHAQPTSDETATVEESVVSSLKPKKDEDTETIEQDSDERVTDKKDPVDAIGVMNIGSFPGADAPAKEEVGESTEVNKIDSTNKNENLSGQEPDEVVHTVTVDQELDEDEQNNVVLVTTQNNAEELSNGPASTKEKADSGAEFQEETKNDDEEASQPEDKPVKEGFQNLISAESDAVNYDQVSDEAQTEIDSDVTKVDEHNVNGKVVEASITTTNDDKPLREYGSSEEPILESNSPSSDNVKPEGIAEPAYEVFQKEIPGVAAPANEEEIEEPREIDTIDSTIENENFSGQESDEIVHTVTFDQKLDEDKQNNVAPVTTQDNAEVLSSETASADEQTDLDPETEEGSRNDNEEASQHEDKLVEEGSQNIISAESYAVNYDQVSNEAPTEIDSDVTKIDEEFVSTQETEPNVKEEVVEASITTTNGTEALTQYGSSEHPIMEYSSPSLDNVESEGIAESAYEVFQKETPEVAPEKEEVEEPTEVNPIDLTDGNENLSGQEPDEVVYTVTQKLNENEQNVVALVTTQDNAEKHSHETASAEEQADIDPEAQEESKKDDEKASQHEDKPVKEDFSNRISAASDAVNYDQVSNEEPTEIDSDITKIDEEFVSTMKTEPNVNEEAVEAPKTTTNNTEPLKEHGSSEHPILESSSTSSDNVESEGVAESACETEILQKETCEVDVGDEKEDIGDAEVANVVVGSDVKYVSNLNSTEADDGSLDGKIEQNFSTDVPVDHTVEPTEEDSQQINLKEANASSDDVGAGASELKPDERLIDKQVTNNKKEESMKLDTSVEGQKELESIREDNFEPASATKMEELDTENQSEEKEHEKDAAIMAEVERAGSNDQVQEQELNDQLPETLQDDVERSSVKETEAENPTNEAQDVNLTTTSAPPENDSPLQATLEHLAEENDTLTVSGNLAANSIEVIETEELVLTHPPKVESQPYLEIVVAETDYNDQQTSDKMEADPSKEASNETYESTEKTNENQENIQSELKNLKVYDVPEGSLEDVGNQKVGGSNENVLEEKKNVTDEQELQSNDIQVNVGQSNEHGVIDQNTEESTSFDKIENSDVENAVEADTHNGEDAEENKEDAATGNQEIAKNEETVETGEDHSKLFEVTQSPSHEAEAIELQQKEETTEESRTNDARRSAGDDDNQNVKNTPPVPELSDELHEDIFDANEKHADSEEKIMQATQDSPAEEASQKQNEQGSSTSENKDALEFPDQTFEVSGEGTTENTNETPVNVIPGTPVETKSEFQADEKEYVPVFASEDEIERSDEEQKQNEVNANSGSFFDIVDRSEERFQNPAPDEINSDAGNLEKKVEMKEIAVENTTKSLDVSEDQSISIGENKPEESDTAAVDPIPDLNSTFEDSTEQDHQKNIPEKIETITDELSEVENSDIPHSNEAPQTKSQNLEAETVEELQEGSILEPYVIDSQDDTDDHENKNTTHNPEFFTEPDENPQTTSIEEDHKTEQPLSFEPVSTFNFEQEAEKLRDESDPNEQLNKQDDEILNEKDTENVFEQEIEETPKLDDNDTFKVEQSEQTGKTEDQLVEHGSATENVSTTETHDESDSKTTNTEEILELSTVLEDSPSEHNSERSFGDSKSVTTVIEQLVEQPGKIDEDSHSENKVEETAAPEPVEIRFADAMSSKIFKEIEQMHEKSKLLVGNESEEIPISVDKEFTETDNINSIEDPEEAVVETFNEPQFETREDLGEMTNDKAEEEKFQREVNQPTEFELSTNQIDGKVIAPEGEAKPSFNAQNEDVISAEPAQTVEPVTTIEVQNYDGNEKEIIENQEAASVESIENVSEENVPDEADKNVDLQDQIGSKVAQNRTNLIFANDAKVSEHAAEDRPTESESVIPEVLTDISEKSPLTSINETITEQPITVVEVIAENNENDKTPAMAITELTINTTVEQVVDDGTDSVKDVERVAETTEHFRAQEKESPREHTEKRNFKPLSNLIHPSIKKTKSIDAAIANLDLLAEPIQENEMGPPVTTKHEMLYTIKENIHDPTGDDRRKIKQKVEVETVPVEKKHVANDYLPFGTENVPEDPFSKKENDEKGKEAEVCVICDIVEDADPDDVPYKQWKDEDVISLKSLKTLVAEVGCITETEPTIPENTVVEQVPEVEKVEETLKILKICPSEPELLDMDLDDEDVFIVPDEELEDDVFESAPGADAIVNQKEDVMTRSVVTESELNEMDEQTETGVEDVQENIETPKVESQTELLEVHKTEETTDQISEDRELSKTPTFEKIVENTAEKTPEPEKAIILQSVELELTHDTVKPTSTQPLEVVTELSVPESENSVSPVSPNTIAEYDQIPDMGIASVPDSPQEKAELKDIDDEDNSECLDSIGDLSEKTIQRFNSSFDDSPLRRDSFSSISSFGDRQKFRTAIENIRQDLLPFQSSISQYLDPQNEQLLSRLTMDSPSDLSPNAPPTGFENPAAYFANLEQNREAHPTGQDQPSGEGSLDSSEFEKVEHEGLEDYGNHGHVSDPMQQSIFGSLQGNEHDKKPNLAEATPLLRYDDGFLLVDKHEIETTPQSSKMSHDDVIEKNYFAGDDSSTAKLLESPIAEEARKLVQDAVESASDYAKSAHDAGDDIARELDQHASHALDSLHEKASDLKDDVAAFVEQPSPVKDTLEKTHDGLSDFVHEKVPETFDHVKQEVTDFVEDYKPHITEPVKEAVDNLHEVHDDVAKESESIGKSVEQVHDEVDSFLKDVHREPSPLISSEFADQPHFGEQTPEEEETTYDRRGPLTIPEEEKNDDLSDFDPLVSGATGAAFGSAVANAMKEEDDVEPPKFESVPRPPTPPKDITDEVVQPAVVKLGPAPSHSHPSTPHHSILKHHGNGEPWFDFKNVDPAILDLIYWRDPKKSAIALSLTLLALFIFGRFPLLSVLSYSGLGLLAATLGFRVFKTIEAQIKKTGGENPFQEILAQDLALPQEKVHAQVDCLVEHGTYLANRVKKLIFVENILDSVKFGLLLWSLTYIASWFSGFALIFLAVVGIFSIPKLYETYQEPIDAHLAVLNGHIQNVQNLLEEKIPFLRRAPVAVEEKKEQ